jgi:hypothetical protein
MHPTTTRTRPAALWAALALLGAVGLAAACGGGGDDAGDQATGNGEGFCQTMESLDERFGGGQAPSEDEITTLLQVISTIDPPAEREDVWDDIIAAQEFTDDPASATPDERERITTAFEELDEYMESECGL